MTDVALIAISFSKMLVLCRSLQIHSLQTNKQKIRNVLLRRSWTIITIIFAIVGSTQMPLQLSQAYLNVQSFPFFSFQNALFALFVVHSVISIQPSGHKLILSVNDISKRSTFQFRAQGVDDVAHAFPLQLQFRTICRPFSFTCAIL